MADPALLSFSWCPGHGVSRNIAPTSAFAFIPGQSPANWVRDPSPLSSGIHSGPFYQPRPRPPSVSNWCACFPQHCCPNVQMGHHEQPGHRKDYQLCLFMSWHLTMNSSTASLPLVSKVSAGPLVQMTSNCHTQTTWEAWIQHSHSWVTLKADPVMKKLCFEVMCPTKY